MAKAPPPQKKNPAVTLDDKVAAAEKVRAALGEVAPLSDKTGTVSAEEIKARALKNPPPSRKPVENGVPAAAVVDSSSTDSPVTAGKPNVAAELAEIVEKAIGKGVEANTEAVKAVNNQLKKFAGNVADGFEAVFSRLSTLENGLAALHAASSTASEDRTIKVQAIDHGVVRVMFATLPEDNEWIEDWSARVGEQYGIPPEELIRYAREFGFTEIYEGEDGGEAVCATNEGQMGA